MYKKTNNSSRRFVKLITAEFFKINSQSQMQNFVNLSAIFLPRYLIKGRKCFYIGSKKKGNCHNYFILII